VAESSSEAECDNPFESCDAISNCPSVEEYWASQGDGFDNGGGAGVGDFHEKLAAWSEKVGCAGREAAIEGQSVAAIGECDTRLEFANFGF
jgi:hypothetical protein